MEHWQTIAALACVAVAAALLLRRVLGFWRNADGGCGTSCGGCGSGEKTDQRKDVIPVELDFKSRP